MNPPIISVIIPTYNRKKYLPLALESVLKQTYKNYEIIVIDDGSDDGTNKALCPYLDKITYIYQKNSGVSSARNNGIKNAKGNWIAFLDSDDEWLPEYLNQQIKKIYKDPGLIMLITNARNISSEGKYEDIFEQKKILKLFKNGNFIINKRALGFIIKNHITALQPTIMKRKNILDVGMFDTSINIAEDLDLIARMSLNGNVGIYSETLVNIYRRKETTDNLSKQLYEKGIYSQQCFDYVYCKLLSFKNITKNEINVISRARSSNLRGIANLKLIEKKKKEANELFNKAFKIDPSFYSLFKYIISFLPTKISSKFIYKLKRNSN